MRNSRNTWRMSVRLSKMLISDFAANLLLVEQDLFWMAYQQDEHPRMEHV